MSRQIHHYQTTAHSCPRQKKKLHIHMPSMSRLSMSQRGTTMLGWEQLPNTPQIFTRNDFLEIELARMKLTNMHVAHLIHLLFHNNLPHKGLY